MKDVGRIILFLFLTIPHVMAQQLELFDHHLLNKPAPLFSATTLSGKQIDLKDFKGMVLQLDFWSLSCAVCFQELPVLNELVEKYAAYDFRLISVMDNTREQLLERFEVVEGGYKMKRPLHGNDRINFEIIPNGKEIMARYFELKGFPQGFFIDQQGTVDHYEMGFSLGMGIPGEITCRDRFIIELDKLLGIRMPEPEKEITLQSGDMIMDFYAVDQRDSLVSIRKYGDRFIYLTFWDISDDQWVNDLMERNAELEKKSPQENLVFLNVCINCEQRQWMDFLEQKKLPGINLNTEGNWGDKLKLGFAIKSTPAHFLVGHDNKLIGAEVGKDLVKVLNASKN